jgi:hypothetical protein
MPQRHDVQSGGGVKKNQVFDLFGKSLFTPHMSIEVP